MLLLAQFVHVQQSLLWLTSGLLHYCLHCRITLGYQKTKKLYSMCMVAQSFHRNCISQLKDTVNTYWPRKETQIQNSAKQFILLHSVASCIVPPTPHNLLGSWFPLVPLRRHPGMKQVQQTIPVANTGTIRACIYTCLHRWVCVHVHAHLHVCAYVCVMWKFLLK